MKHSRIKRPLVLAVIFLTAGVLAALAHIPPPVPAASAAAGMVCFCLYRQGSLHKSFFIQILIFFFLFTIGYFTTYIHDNFDKGIRTGEPGVLCARAVKIVEGTYSRRIFLKDCSFDGKRLINGIVLEVSGGGDSSGINLYAADLTAAALSAGKSQDVILSEVKIERGDYIELRGCLMLFEKAENQGQFDSREYYRSLGYLYCMSDPELIGLERGKNLVLRWLLRLRAAFKAAYGRCCSPVDAGVYEAMVLGDKSDMDSTLGSLFTAGGIGHILAISGLHISMIGMGLFRLLRKAGFMFPASAAFSGIFVILYGVMTGNSVSTVRAIVMFGCAVYAQVLGRKYDILSAASLAAILIILENPFIVLNSGFLLSFLAIAGVSLVSAGFRVKWLKWLTVPIAIQLATLPVMLWFYYEVPVYSVFLNIIVVPLVSLIMASALLCGIAGMVSSWAGAFFAGAGHYILLLFSRGCELMLSLPGSIFVAGRPRLWQIAAYYLLLLLFSLRKNIVGFIHRRLADSRKRYSVSEYRLYEGIAGCLVQLLIVPALILVLMRTDSGLEVDFLSVGQGDAVFISIPGGGSVFIDGGSSSKSGVYDKVIEPFLKYKGIRRLDFVFITHCDEDHCNGWSEALGEGAYIPEISYLVLNGSDYVKYEQWESAKENEDESAIVYIAEKMEEAGADILWAEPETVYRFGECSLISINEGCVNPSAKALVNGSAKASEIVSEKASEKASVQYGQALYSNESENDNSIVLLLKYGECSMLFTGDVTSEMEAALAKKIAGYGVSGLSLIKVAHHGSKYSSNGQFLESVRPALSVISCSAKNSYGHPHEETLLRLKEVNSHVYRTDEMGQIRIYCDKEGGLCVNGVQERENVLLYPAGGAEGSGKGD